MAIVTGGSRGIGAAICKKLAANGLSVHLVYKNADGPAEQVAADITHAGGEVIVHKADVSLEGEVKSLIGKVLKSGDTIDVLVNNAAIIDDRLLAMTSLERWENVIRVNLTGPFLMCRAVLPSMLEQSWGRIINLSSNSVRIPGAGQSAYAASKGGVEALTRALAMEVGRKGIRVNTVAPGRVKTDMTENVANQLGGDSGPRWGVPEDLSGIVAFLASDEADYIQGQTITVDGGRLVMRSAKG
ncbi:SDR family NAD(P)-dependent oxidoreductase [Dyella flagellata]|uniref:SDR family NAD(P)-dependent oxidoreductase n=1 Tax=Dyella flagellata TaxID=1867833 RepID=UPI0024E13679|nr:3-oxoacyl-ACP reductase family protein [Dyella flagellata]